MKTDNFKTIDTRKCFDCICDRCLESFVRRSDSNQFSTCTKCSGIVAGEKRRTHGEHNSTSRLHVTWSNMKRRCLNPTNKEKRNYQSKNITLCAEWLEYVSFRDWAMANGYNNNLTIDRIDNLKGYYPDNCRFTDYSTQNANRGPTNKNKTGYVGVSIHGDKFMSTANWKGKQIYLGRYSTAIEAAMIRDQYIIDNGLPHALNLTSQPLKKPQHELT